VYLVGFEVLTQVVRNTTMYIPMKVNRRFRVTYYIHLQGWKVIQARNRHCFMLVSCLAYSWNLKMEATCVRNVGWLSPDYAALYLRRQKNSSRYISLMAWSADSNVAAGTCNTTETEQAGLAVTLYICLREVLGSNLGPGHRLSWKRFNDGFLSPSWQMPII
jgi:hypothetical protein